MTQHSRYCPLVAAATLHPVAHFKTFLEAASSLGSTVVSILWDTNKGQGLSGPLDEATVTGLLAFWNKNSLFLSVFLKQDMSHFIETSQTRQLLNEYKVPHQRRLQR